MGSVMVISVATEPDVAVSVPEMQLAVQLECLGRWKTPTIVRTGLATRAVVSVALVPSLGIGGSGELKRSVLAAGSATVAVDSCVEGFVGEEKGLREGKAVASTECVLDVRDLLETTEGAGIVGPDVSRELFRGVSADVDVLAMGVPSNTDSLDGCDSAEETWVFVRTSSVSWPDRAALLVAAAVDTVVLSVFNKRNVSDDTACSGETSTEPMVLHAVYGHPAYGTVKSCPGQNEETSVSKSDTSTWLASPTPTRL